MKRILIVGPGPLRPSVGVHTSAIAAVLATAFVECGHTVIAADASPTSILLADSAPSRRYVGPVDAKVLERIIAAEAIDAITLRASERYVVSTLADSELTAGAWLGGTPALLDSESEQATDAIASASDDDDNVIDVVVASDKKNTSVLAAFKSRAAGRPVAGIAIADTEHTWLPGDSGSFSDLVKTPPREPGLSTLRCVIRRGQVTVLARDPVDTSLWLAAGYAGGVRVGVLLAHLLLGETLDVALREASAPAGGRALVRTPSFDFEPFPNAKRSLDALPKSLGATLATDALSVAPPRGPNARRVLLVGPGAVSVDHGAEASTAAFLAAREITRLGHELVLVTPREGTGAERFAARTYTTLDVESVRAGEQPTDVLTGFGSPGPKPSLDGEPPPENAIELHVLVMTDGTRARILGTFEHVERAAVHAEDAAAVFPSLAVDDATRRSAEEQSLPIAAKLGARGVVTARWSIGPLATVRFAGASAGITTHTISLGLIVGRDVVAEAVRIALGENVETTPILIPRHAAVEEHVFPFAAFGVTDTKLDRRRRSTGSVLAIADTTSRAYAKALAAMDVALARPNREAGTDAARRAIVLAGADSDVSALADVGRRLFALGFDLLASPNVARALERARVPHRATDDAASLVANGEVAAAVATTGATDDRAELRRAALVAGVPCFTTVDLVKVAVRALEESNALDARMLEDWTKAT